MKRYLKVCMSLNLLVLSLGSCGSAADNGIDNCNELSKKVLECTGGANAGATIDRCTADIGKVSKACDESVANFVKCMAGQSCAVLAGGKCKAEGEAIVVQCNDVMMSKAFYSR